MPRINPLAPASGGTRCANFPANSRVSVQLFAAGRPARADRNMTWSTAALAGGRLDLFWQGGRQPVRPPVVQPRDTRFDQTIAITTHTGSRERLVQTFTAGAARPNVTRICLHNRKNGARMMTHNFMPRINPLAPGTGSRSCANFPANSRVTVQLFAAGRPARADRNMTWSTTALAGGRLDLFWQ